jgi:hypothetical protein
MMCFTEEANIDAISLGPLGNPQAPGNLEVPDKSTGTKRLRAT